MTSTNIVFHSALLMSTSWSLCVNRYPDSGAMLVGGKKSRGKYEQIEQRRPESISFITTHFTQDTGTWNLVYARETKLISCEPVGCFISPIHISFISRPTPPPQPNSQPPKYTHTVSLIGIYDCRPCKTNGPIAVVRSLPLKLILPWILLLIIIHVCQFLATVSCGRQCTGTIPCTITTSVQQTPYKKKEVKSHWSVQRCWATAKYFLDVWRSCSLTQRICPMQCLKMMKQKQEWSPEKEYTNWAESVFIFLFQCFYN